MLRTSTNKGYFDEMIKMIQLKHYLNLKKKKKKINIFLVRPI